MTVRVSARNVRSPPSLEFSRRDDDNDHALEKESQNDVDRELVLQILRSDERAFERLVEKYHPRIFRLVLGILDDWQLSEDVCQEIFVKVHMKLAGFGFRSKFSTWLFRVAVNAALKARGRANRMTTASLPDDAAAPSREDPTATLLEESELINKLLRPLPPHLRTVVHLKEREGLSYNEIARVLGCSPGAVEQRVHRAFVKLREIWKGRMHEFGFER